VREGQTARRRLSWRVSPAGENGRMSLSFERTQSVAIIGGGPGGYEAALAAAQLGAEVTIVERAGIGGSAVITDVVPSKTLIATADAAVATREAGDLGVQLFAKTKEGKPLKPEIAINLAAVNKRLLSLARQQSDDMRASLVEAGVRIISGHGRLEGDDAVIVSTGPGGTDFDRIEADTFVVSTGSSPRELPSAKPDGERILNWTQLYEMDSLPPHLVVVGSGVTGAEFASAYMNLGAKVTLISSRDRVLPGEDVDAALVLERVFKRGGMTVLSKSRAQKVERTADGVVVTLEDGRTVEASHCLMAVGSTPKTANVGLEEAGVQMTDSGHIQVNRVARTSVPNIYAAGDCTTFVPLASVASMQGRTAVFHAMGDVVIPLERRRIAQNIFTAPEIATVGWQENDIDEGLVAGEVHKLPLAANPRAKMMGIKDGFVKLIAQKGSGTVIGGVIVGPRASELIYPIAIAAERRLTVDQVSRVFAVYPSLSGSITDAARAMHIVNKG
jgi:pyruvate/2-oxoglutarate dehydrogenase complex dihydrolipoamide dehydrogenase (E3) component